MLRRLVFVVVFALGAGLVGCGNEGSSPNDPMSVDTVPPAAVANLEAHVVAQESPGVELSWNAGFEADLAGYRVYRVFEPTLNPGPERGPDQIEAAVLLDVITEPYYYDSAVVPGVTYTYAVSAFDVSQNESALVEKEVTISISEPGTPAQPKKHTF